MQNKVENNVNSDAKKNGLDRANYPSDKSKL